MNELFFMKCVHFDAPESVNVNPIDFDDTQLTEQFRFKLMWNLFRADDSIFYMRSWKLYTLMIFAENPIISQSCYPPSLF